MARRRTKRRPPPADRGNFVSEWFGHRVYPAVTAKPKSLEDQKSGRCPFLSIAIIKETSCVKSAAASGVCTISSASNGPRQDWLVCPYRALDAGLLENAARRLFAVAAGGPLFVTPAPTLGTESGRATLTQVLKDGRRAIVYLRSKLGGEISISATERSPELAFDITMVEVVSSGDEIDLAKYGILEVQTMDFHGTYKRAVDNLKHALRLHRADFHRVLRENRGGWVSEDVEGPNIANVFKRTFYQMLLKFQIGAHESSAGCVLAIPTSVWDSWQRHLGKPELQARSDGTFALVRPGDPVPTGRVPAWIYVFDILSGDSRTPNPIVVSKVIATNAESISHYAVKIAPEAALAEGGSAGLLLATIRRRLATFWPALRVATIPTKVQRG